MEFFPREIKNDVLNEYIKSSGSYQFYDERFFSAVGERES